ncbi:hypothetical protein PF002_g14556 [Phytophthora fragariae]|uniref:Mitochondrial pyruvate carrier n=1 Tax=Phytophthora fragariae TaxID=53985 RepID=A0A6A3KEY2_9STRA|nr:hypothetical protein PF003_g33078 [Phytophthora fragariae]KAE9005609.1 hypothetical protein PF011_g11968 [Phytophthora fragariae]KAE9224935.1 hypothetical protein PF002_g14556 [Phytophthora fragariae]KAE9305898.1 hypothetical protein PF001_g12386 [Phytophthora fragariae]
MLPSIVPRIQQKVMEQQIVANSPKLVALLNHPAGPFTVHFWAPTFKWAISIANVADMRRSPETISVAQQTAVTATGLIWSRYSLVITPKNWNLFAVNVFMAGTGLVQFYRKFSYDQSHKAGCHAVGSRHCCLLIASRLLLIETPRRQVRATETCADAVAESAR